jgi:hypothetical protein
VTTRSLSEDSPTKTRTVLNNRCSRYKSNGQLHAPTEKSSQYPRDEGRSVPQSRSGREEKTCPAQGLILSQQHLIHCVQPISLKNFVTLSCNVSLVTCSLFPSGCPATSCTNQSFSHAFYGCSPYHPFWTVHAKIFGEGYATNYESPHYLLVSFRAT